MSRNMNLDELFWGIEEYKDFAPTYDDWKEKYIQQDYDYAGQEYGLAGELYGMAQDRATFERAQRGQRREGAATNLQRQLTGMGMQMGSTLAQAQESAYDIFGQGEEVASGGLGTRSGLTRRAMRGIEQSAERGLAGQAMSGLQAKSQYESTLADLAAGAFGSAQQLQQAGISYESAGISYDRAATERNRAMESLVYDYEDEMYDYLLQLGSMDIWASDRNPNVDYGTGQSGQTTGDLYDPNANPEGGGQNLGGWNNTGMSYEEWLNIYGGGDKNTGGGSGSTVPRTGP